MRRFVSLPYKIMGLIITFLVLASVLLTFLWIDKNDQDYLTQQQTLRTQDNKQFQLINDMLRSRIETWFESFVHFQANYSDSVDATAFFLEHEFEYLKVSWQINNIWLFDEQAQLKYSTTADIPAYLAADINQVIEQQISVSHIRCEIECQQQISLPILANQTEMVVLSINSSLLEAMAALHQTTFAELAIVKVSEGAVSGKITELQVQSPISQSNRKFMQNILQSVPAELSLASMLNSGYRLIKDNNSYLLNLLPIDATLQEPLFLLAVHDITAASRAHADYRLKVIGISVLVVALCSLALWLISMQFRKRLMAVTNMLPLLAEKNYAQFHQQKVENSHFFSDEIELLQDTASVLGHQLESLDRTVENYTRELEHIALFDRLTGLPNRNKLHLVLADLLTQLDHNKLRVNVLFLDFDQFRKINDSYGHDIGDSFLLQAAQHIAHCLSSQDSLFRLGGDEFVVVFCEPQTSHRAPILANALVNHFHLPVKVGIRHFYSTCSVGITSACNSHISVEEIVRQADMAMYVAKDNGGNSVREFDYDLLKSVLRRAEIEHEVRVALEDEQFCFALQPQVEIATGRLVGFEALIRWIHPDKGFISPDEFIPVIESSESIINLGYWGLKQAFVILQRLDDIGVRGKKIAVNLSASQFLDPLLVPFLRQQLDEFKRDAGQIELELTERTVVADVEQTLVTMRQLQQLGFSFSIDDFGTGYSSLAYLKQMPVEYIKIDRSFVSAMHIDNADMKIVSSTIAMVNKLGMKVIAEGVETAEQMQLLDGMGCDLGQGYFISRPIFEKDIYKLLPQKLANDIWIDFS